VSCLAVVNAGEVEQAVAISSKPTIAISPGTLYPAYCIARIAPIAIKSLAVQMASNFIPEAISC
jgi:hypothetical protein